jgi:hypothetical protein
VLFDGKVSLKPKNPSSKTITPLWRFSVIYDEIVIPPVLARYAQGYD